MLLRSLAAAVTVALALSPAHAQQNAKGKEAKGKAPAKKRVVHAAKERHQCKVGPYEKQTRLVLETVKNKPVYVAYWSSNGPFHCSFETWPGDGRAHWVDSKAGTVINLISGTMLIERNGDKYYIHAREVDRMPYCGTFGTISGVLTVPLKKKDQCDWVETTSEDAGMLKQNENAPADAPPADAPAVPAPLEAAPVDPSPRTGDDPGRLTHAAPG